MHSGFSKSIICSLFCVLVRNVYSLDNLDELDKLPANNMSSSVANKNISVILHAPVIVPTLNIQNEPVQETTTMVESTTTAHDTTLVFGRPLEAANQAFALVNGSPIFFNPSTPSPVAGQDNAISAILNSKQQEEKDTKSIVQSVMKAVEHMNNVSQQQQPSSPLAEPPTSNASSNSSSVTVVIVPLVQNAFDLPDPNTKSASQLAANNPVVFSKQEGNHTTVHVLVKREDGSPSATHNAHGPLSDADFTTAQPQPLSKSVMIIVDPVAEIANSSHANVSVSVGELVTEHEERLKNASQLVNAVPFVKADNSTSLNNVSFLLPSVLVPLALPSVVLTGNSHPQQPHQTHQIQNTQPIHDPPVVSEMPATLMSVIVPSTLPSAPKVTPDITDPLAIKPLPVGAFSFLPVNDKEQHAAANLKS